MTGQTVGHYQITSQLGAGGMGEVYRARDTKLGRDVAIKVLPRSFAAEQDRLGRFEQEARTLASLNHPGIMVIHDSGIHDGAPYLISELLEGQTLRDVLKDGPLPPRKAAEYAVQIARALAAAHNKGIIHRDLKPENLFITQDERVKVLDFGLAKLRALAAQSEIPASARPTIINATEPGMVLGTPGYMSPEQARGGEAEIRSDIFSLGAVLYEMLCGQRAFEGESSVQVLNAILTAEPPELFERVERLPPALERVARRCLEKRPEQRFQTAADLAFALENSISSGGTILRGQGVKAKRSLSVGRFLPWLAAVTGISVGVYGLFVTKRAPAVAAPTRLSMLVPANRPVSLPGSPTRSVALSPDGTQLVYLSTNLEVPADQPGGRDQLQLRSLASLEVRDLPGTTGARQPFFSPDGQWIAFFTNTAELKKISLAGGNPVTLAQKVNGSTWAFGVWTEDNNIIYSTMVPGSGAGLHRVSAEGGKVTDLTTVDAAKGETLHESPALVPSSGAVLFGVRLSGTNRIDAVMLDSGKRQVVLDNAQSPLLLGGGHLLFERGAELLIAPFDATRLTVTGPAVPVIEKVRLDNPSSPAPQAEMAVARNGTVAYLPGANTMGVLGLVGRDGAFQAVALPRNNFERPRVSPDGRSIAYIVDGTVYVYDIQRGSTTKLTQDGRDNGLAWHPDGRSLALYSSRQGSESGVVLRTLDGRERLLVSRPAGVTRIVNFSWSPDGTRLAYTVQTGNQHDIWVLTMGEKPETQLLLHGAPSQHSPKFSPDGRWLASVSDESGRAEVYVQQYPQGERFAVSTTGGNGPVWGHDGKGLFYQGFSEGVPKMMAVAVTSDGASLQLAKPVPLFNLRVPGPTGAIEEYAYSGNSGVGYDVLPDGRFVMVRGADRAGIREIVVVQNWFEEFREKR